MEPENAYSTKQKVFIYFLRIMKLFTVLSLLLTIVSDCLTMKSASESSLATLDKAFIVMAQAGYILMCVLLILSEFDPKWFQKQVQLLHFWAPRGVGLIWIGVQTIYSTAAVQHTSAEISANTVETIGTVVGWILISIGGFYIVMSFLCLKKLVGIDRADDLEVRLITTGGDEHHDKSNNRSQQRDQKEEDSSKKQPASNRTTSGSSSATANSEDCILAMNLATALGMSVDEARRFFGGKDGAKEAANYAKSNGKKSSSLAYVPPATSNSSVSNNEPTKEPVPQKSAATYTPKEQAPPQEVEGKKKKLDDDDELEARYYASMQQQQ